MTNNSSPLFNITGKVIILTGGTGFLGREYTYSLSQAGARVFVWDHSLESKEKFQTETGAVALLSVDITNPINISMALEHMGETHNVSTIDALINNAAMNPAIGSGSSGQQFAPYEEYSIDLWRKEIEVNLTGTMNCMQAVTPWMKKQGFGSIINVASEVSVIAHDHRVYADPDNRKYKSPAYTASKTAILGLTRQWAAYLGQYGIRVNAFSPGGVFREGMPPEFVERFGKTTMFGRMAKLGEYNGVIQFLCSDASSFMTGQNLVVDGGKTAW